MISRRPLGFLVSAALRPRLQNAFIRAEVDLARTNLADLAPPPVLVWLLYTHPPVAERIRMARLACMVAAGTQAHAKTYIDYFLPNNDEARAMTGKDDPFDQVRALIGMGAHTVIITQGKAGANSSMTLAVKPEEAELLTAADRAGALRVMLRSPSDKTVVSSPGVTTHDLSGTKTFEFATRPPDAQKATPIIINSQSNRQRSEIMIYRGAQGQATSTE